MQDYQLENLLKDHFNLGVHPVDHIRNLKIYVNYVESVRYHQHVSYTQYRSLLSNWYGDDYLEPAEELGLYEIRRKALSHLLRLQQKEKLHVDIHLHTNLDPDTMEENRQMYNILETMRETVYDLMHAGANVTIKQENSYQLEEWRYLLHPHSGKESSFFRLTKEEWEKVLLHRTSTVFLYDNADCCRRNASKEHLRPWSATSRQRTSSDPTTILTRISCGMHLRSDGI